MATSSASDTICPAAARAAIATTPAAPFQKQFRSGDHKLKEPPRIRAMAGNFIPGLGASAPGRPGGIIPSGLGDCSGIVTSGLKTGGIVTSGLKTGGGMFPSSGIMEDFFQFCDDKKAVGPPDKPGPCIGPEEGKVLGTPIGHGQFRLYQVGFCRPTRT